MKSPKAGLPSAVFGLAPLLLVATFAAQPVHSAETATTAGTPVTLPVATAARSLAPQVDRGGGVTVKVTPRELGRNAVAWEFAVVLDTHSEDLSADLARSAVLVDGQGGRHGPLGWDGAGPGGHHREGVLKFKPPVTDPDAVVLEISGVGGVPVRTFRWQVR